MDVRFEKGEVTRMIESEIGKWNDSEVFD